MSEGDNMEAESQSFGRDSPRSRLSTISDAESRMGDAESRIGGRSPMLSHAKFQRRSKSGTEPIVSDSGVLITEYKGNEYYSSSDEDEEERGNYLGYDDDPSTDNGYDTDLEIDDYAYLKGTQREFDCSGVNDYVQECNRLGVIPASYFARHVQDKKFIMKYHGLGPLGAKAIAKPLETNTTIERLDLEGNCIESLGARHIARTMKENMYITELILAENNMGGRGAKAICEMMQNNTLVQVLNLSGNKLNDLDGEMFYNMLEKNSTLKVLLLSHNRFEAKAASYFKEALASNESLRVLDLSWNHFRLQAAVHISDGVKDNYGLTDLKLAMNGFAFEGAVAMGHALKHNQSLSSLDLSCNRIPPYGAIEIAKGLKVNEHLVRLKMSTNPIDVIGSTPLIDAIKRNEGSAMQLLDIGGTMVSEEFDKMHKEISEKRQMNVIHAGVLNRKEVKLTAPPPIDHEALFWSDPMTKLKTFAETSGLRLVDLFKQFDRDNSWTITKEEFMMGVRSANIPLTDAEIDILISRLDQDGDGEVDYKELSDGDEDYRAKKRFVANLSKEKKVNPAPQDKDKSPLDD